MGSFVRTFRSCVWIGVACLGENFKRCFIVTSLDDLNFIFRRFNRNHIRLVVSPNAVTAVTARGELRVVPTISYARKENRDVIVGIGDDPIHDIEATRVRVFSIDARQPSS